MRTRCLPAVLIVFFGATLCARAADAETALSLSDAIRLARERNVDQVMSQARVQQAVQRTWQAYTALLPQVTAEISQMRETKNFESMGIPLPSAGGGVAGPFNSFDARIKFNQIVFDGAAVERLLAVRAGERTTRAVDQKLEQDVMALAAGLYLDARRAQDACRLAEAGFARDWKRLQIAHRSFRSGDGTVLAVREAKALYKEGAVGLQRARTFSRDRLTDLAVALGFSAKETLRLSGDEDAKAYGVPERPAFDPEKHPEAVAARRLMEQRRREESINWAEYFPKLSFMADYGASGQEMNDSRETYTFGAKATMPIFEGGQRPFRIGEAQGRTREAKAAYEDAVRRLEAGAREALESLLTAQSYLDAESSRVAAAGARLSDMRTRLADGTASEWEVIDAAFTDAVAHDLKNQAVMDYLKAHVRLAHALGQVERLMPAQQAGKN